MPPTLVFLRSLIVWFPKFLVSTIEMTEDTLTFQYVIENIPGPGADEDLFEHTLLGCNCRSYCRSSTGCSCQPYGENYNEQSLLIQDRVRSRFDRPVIECGANCTCGPGCGNRVVQNGISIPVEIFHTDSAKGYGLRCSSAIREGQFVVTYAGEVIGVDEGRDRLAAAYGAEQPCFLFTLREQAENCASPLLTYIDASFYGNIGRFVNHSCEPNLNIVVVRYSTSVPHLAMFANRDIVEFEELCYSYGTFRSQSTQARKVCLCGTSNCVGYLPYDFSYI
ncbi:Histone-lysine N-methyltransferase SETMAR [Trichinella spiralis]|uniref:Histone-lysine N-methyltransferase SETMAR n=1 Tax=Trichinella spiralis TaxID=6334 RepID=A0ABR3KT52_TRISP